ncbi:MAG: glutamine--fructose-6-phosphate transaminase (isomerizing) [Erysipelotrichales bacterium]|nr:glutamine--fructose-6-phosphate transaminase (isomerizing) [Erysipelotrichales bacterium]
MCGIVGIVGNHDSRNYLLNGLKSLEYRGYDSAGIAILENNEIKNYRVVGRVNLLDSEIPSLINASLGIGHTRWATHGEPSVKNCHPHKSNDGFFTIVHNGVIENFQEVKNELKENGYHFYSDTDTEVIANVLEDEYKKTNDVLDAINNSLKRVHGSLAIAIIFKNDNDRLYFAKRKSPLLIGIGERTNYLASDALPMIKTSSKFIDILDDQYGFMSEHEVKVYQNGVKQKAKYTTRNAELLNIDLNGYPHYMLKEIEEIPSCISRLVDNYFNNGLYKFDEKMIEELKNVRCISFIACGTSYHASLIGKHYMESIGKMSNVYIASEWAYFPRFIDENEMFILVSQSGETADVITCLKKINETNTHKTITITNTKGSTLERDATYSALLYAGVEIAVASTKAYNAQVALLYLLKSAIIGDINAPQKLLYTNQLLNNIINRKDEIKEIANKVKDASNAFFLGRGLDYFVAMEGSLKLKEISYIHSEAFPGGELKHGPIALIEENTPVFGFISNKDIALAIRGNFSEVKARKAIVYSFVTKENAISTDTFVIDDFDKDLSILGSVMISQYLSYYVALLRGNDIDKPRNLAKSVTVE